ncbi:hypothetical protein CASFOL_042184 [Castilleja foliolosa]|uniref:Cystatin domain-containing protein n=1 Tax=Castilleja foliolosa TaxID=1961234 RepID=A0ABD3BB86_9LAMI
MAISTASRSFLFELFLIMVISDEVFCRGHIEFPDPDEDELAQFAITEVNRLAHTIYIMVNLESSLAKRVSRDVFSYDLSISVTIRGVNKVVTYLAKVEIDRTANKRMLVSFKSRQGRIIY